MVGPVGNFNTSCLTYVQSGGAGQLVVYSLPNNKLGETPIRAVPNDYGKFVFGHDGAPAHMFFGAEDGDVTLSLTRKSRGMCS
jgi:hypothetical protein